MTKYKIFDTEIEVSTGIENSRYIRNTFYPFIKSSEDMFERWYNKQWDCDSVWDNLGDIMCDIAEPVTDCALKVLNQNKIYTIDYSKLYHIIIENCFTELYERAKNMMHLSNNIDSTKESAREYRELRKESRGRVVGGGFGLSGAIKGMAQAAAINATTGLAHSAVNAVGNIGSSISASTQKSKIYHDAKSALKDSISDFVWEVMKKVREILKEERGFIFEFQSQANKDKANAILNNIIEGQSPEAQQRELLVQALNLNYDNSKLYQRIWFYYGDATGDLRKMAEDFNMPLDEYIENSIAAYEKNMCLEYCAEYIKSSNQVIAACKYVDKIKLTIEKIESFLDSHNVPYEQSKKRQELLDALVQADIHNRTVEDIVYETQDEANNIRHDITLFESVLEDKNIYDEDAFDILLKQEYLSEKFIFNLKMRFENELTLRDPKQIYENLHGTIFTTERQPLIKSLFSVTKKVEQDSYNELITLINRICPLEMNDKILCIIHRPTGLLGSNKKAGLFFTNTHLKIISKKILGNENAAFSLTEIKDVEALGENKYILKLVNTQVYQFDILEDKLTIIEQNQLASLIMKCISLIRNTKFSPDIVVDVSENFMVDTTPLSDTIVYPDAPTDTQSIVICRFCGKENMAGKNFCKNCGGKLGEYVSDVKMIVSVKNICPGCGNTIKEGKMFCSKCGKKIG